MRKPELKYERSEAGRVWRRDNDEILDCFVLRTRWLKIGGQWLRELQPRGCCRRAGDTIDVFFADRFGVMHVVPQFRRRGPSALDTSKLV